MSAGTATLNIDRIAGEVHLRPEQVRSVVALLDAGNTVPFITRYRKEATGNLDEEQIRQVEKRAQFLRQLEERAQTVLRLIEAQNKLTPELRRQIEEADSIKRLDDLYLPFRPRRRSRAEAAREQGLEPLADRLWNRADNSVAEKSAAEFLNAELKVNSVEDALRGACDILAERISEDVAVRDTCRKTAWRTGQLTVSGTKSAEEVGREFQNYLDYSEPVWKVPPHRALAINRGEKEGALKVRFDWDRELATRSIAGLHKLGSHPRGTLLQNCVNDSVERLLHPSIEREVRRELTDNAGQHAIQTFARNLRSLLLQAPLRNQRVLAIDPGFRTGCKLAVLDECGQCLHTDVVYVTGSADKQTQGAQRVAALLNEHNIRLVAIGNGTACRETEELISEVIATHCPDCRYLIVNEAGASIYSASTVAREEFPDLDATARGTISIGRRLQDPLSELVKIEAQHIGVGMYQHDMAPKELKESLDSVVESCVNFVGVDLNTASVSLLRYVSGLNQLIARRVVEWREQRGRFLSRRQLLEVAGIGEATFTQAAGFLKIIDGEDPLDATWIHPESYPVVRRLLERAAIAPTELDRPAAERTELIQRLQALKLEPLASELGTGLTTLRDIVDALARPGRDPRTDLPGPVFRAGVLKMEDLSAGMELTGTVLNVLDFGAFVDVGLKDSGLVHVSQLANHFIRNPHDIVSVGDIVTVWVQSVDLVRRRVSLSMIPPGQKPAPGDRHAKSPNPR